MSSRQKKHKSFRWQKGAVIGVKHYSSALDCLMLILTCGLWVIWMAYRPVYEYASTDN